MRPVTCVVLLVVATAALHVTRAEDGAFIRVVAVATSGGCVGAVGGPLGGEVLSSWRPFFCSSGWLPIHPSPPSPPHPVLGGVAPLLEVITGTIFHVPGCCCMRQVLSRQEAPPPPLDTCMLAIVVCD